MFKSKTKKHTVDFLFPIALFFVFALCALAIILFAAKVYKNTVDAGNASSASKTATAYITQKVHQNDCGDIKLGNFNGKRALIIESDINDKAYETYIYADDGYLKELFAEVGTTISPSAGTEILEINDIDFESLKDGLYKVTCTENDGSLSTVIVGAKAKND